MKDKEIVKIRSYFQVRYDDEDYSFLSCNAVQF
jgi:hypothetical protein